MEVTPAVTVAVRVNVSAASANVSDTMGARTSTDVLPAAMVAAAAGAQVVPPSVETWSAVPKSATDVAVPAVVLKPTVVAWTLGLDSATVKTAKPPPSATVGLDTDNAGVSLLLPPTPVPSSVMVVVDEAVPRVAPEGADRLTVKVSLPSNVASLVIATVTVCEVTPGAKVSVPVPPVKSAPAVAVPLAVA